MAGGAEQTLSGTLRAAGAGDRGIGGTCEHMDGMLLGRTIDAPLDACGMQEATAMARLIDSQQALLIVASPATTSAANRSNDCRENQC